MNDDKVCVMCLRSFPECICPALPPWVNCKYDKKEFLRCKEKRMKETGKTFEELFELWKAQR